MTNLEFCLIWAGDHVIHSKVEYEFHLEQIRLSLLDKQTLAPIEYICSSFPEIKWEKSRFKKLEILGFDIEAFNLAVIPQLSNLLEISIYETKISHISQITFASNSMVQVVRLNGKDFDKTDLTHKLDA